MQQSLAADRVNYRHYFAWLLRKAVALARYRYSKAIHATSYQKAGRAGIGNWQRRQLRWSSETSSSEPHEGHRTQIRLMRDGVHTLVQTDATKRSAHLDLPLLQRRLGAVQRVDDLFTVQEVFAAAVGRIDGPGGPFKLAGTCGRSVKGGRS